MHMGGELHHSYCLHREDPNVALCYCAWVTAVYWSQIDPKKRPSFSDMVTRLEEIKSRSQMASVLADITNLKRDPDIVMDKTILERILGQSHSHVVSLPHQSIEALWHVIQSGTLTLIVSPCHKELHYDTHYVTVSHNVVLTHIVSLYMYRQKSATVTLSSHHELLSETYCVNVSSKWFWYSLYHKVKKKTYSLCHTVYILIFLWLFCHCVIKNDTRTLSVGLKLWLYMGWHSFVIVIITVSSRAQPSRPVLWWML